MKTGIFITGGAGLLGANWAAEIKDRYAVTLGLHERSIAMEGVDCRFVNLDSPDDIGTAIREAKASIVIHSAAMTNVDACEASPTKAHHDNVVIARNVAQACAAENTKLVHISTDHLFSGRSSMMNEASAIEPLNVYAQTKAEAEVAVLDACPLAIVSRTNFFGWGLPYRKSFSDTIIGALRAGHEIFLFSDAYFTPILMQPLIEAAHNLLEAGASGLFHMAGDERISKYEFGLRLASAFDFDTDLIKPTLLAKRCDLTPRPLDLSLSNAKLRRAIGRPIGGIDSHLSILLKQHEIARSFRNRL